MTILAWCCVAWLIPGLFVAWKRIPWNSRVFLVNWLPYPDQPAGFSLNRAVSSALLAVVATLLWPFYWRAGRLGAYGHDSAGRQDPEAHSDSAASTLAEPHDQSCL